MQEKLLSLAPLVHPFSLTYKFLYHQSFNFQINHKQLNVFNLVGLYAAIRFIRNAMGCSVSYHSVFGHDLMKCP